MSSAFVKAVSGPIHSKIGADTLGQRIKGAFAAGVIGGTASSIGGGRFANGAQTSAFQYLFNEVSGEGDSDAKSFIGKAKKLIGGLKRFFNVGSTDSLTLGVSGKLGGTALSIAGNALNADVASSVGTIVLRRRIDTAYETNYIDLDQYQELMNMLSNDPSKVTEKLQRAYSRKEEYNYETQ